MIVFINGSFGVGKTTVAEMLVQELPNSLLYDAEEVGFMLRNILRPIDWSGDFQNYPMWRTLTMEVARGLRETYERTLIMPMTIRREDYFNEVMTGLASFDTEVHHFCLTASADVIRSRVHLRGEQSNGDWIFDQIEKCVSSFNSDLFEEKIDTATMSPHQITQHIISRVKN
jgi:deoxyadenosine/deoxycytidine kinase